METTATLRAATADDMQAVHQLIYELAVYEKEPDALHNTVEGLVEHGFGANKMFDAIVAEEEGTIVGFALFYMKYSTWDGPSLYLEDFIVTEEKRGKGIGKLLFEEVISIAKQRGASRFEWQVIDWNEPAFNFYKKYGAQFEENWVNARIFLN